MIISIPCRVNDETSLPLENSFLNRRTERLTCILQILIVLSNTCILLLCYLMPSVKKQSEEAKSMSHKKKGQLTKSPERMKHLGQFLKRYFWKRERRAEKKEIDKDRSMD